MSQPSPRTLQRAILAWFEQNARDLPWRRPEASPWAIIVSEFMLQQTPVSRVLPKYEQWIVRWPTPAALAAEPSSEAVRAWGRLGYPRRALRLHAAATAIVDQHSGEVPQTYMELLALPGVGDYTASAVASFAYQQRHVVLDTNIRRVLARAVGGVEFPSASPTKAEREQAEVLVPADAETAARWNVAIMELGALVCTASSPRCEECPIAKQCAWRNAGYPKYDGPARRAQSYDGTDRQCRGRLLAVLRDAEGPVHLSALESAWPNGAQRQRSLAGLLDDGLVVQVGPTTYSLPG